MERLKFAANVLLMVTGFPLLLSANLTRSNYTNNTVVQEKKTTKVKKGVPGNSVTDDVSFVMRYPGAVM